jgi:hypothetical protein
MITANGTTVGSNITPTWTWRLDELESIEILDELSARAQTWSTVVEYFGYSCTGMQRAA